MQPSEMIVLKLADVDILIASIATEVLRRVEPLISGQSKRLVDRLEMAKRLDVSLPTLDRLVSEEKIPSVLIGTRRLFDPSRVIERLTDA